VLLHPTSLPGPYGVGDLGPAARAWVDQLAGAGQTWWQILPLGPPGYGDSPYSALSAFAGNSYLISPELLVQDGLLTAADVPGVDFPANRVDYPKVYAFKDRLFARAWENYQRGTAPALRAAFEAFRTERAGWLDDFALFAALKEAHRGTDWHSWPADFIRREPAALGRARAELAGPVGLHEFLQFLFFRQWQDLKAYARGKGVRVIGDVPIFVSRDSADVWAHPELFLLDEHRRPRVVAGVPPDFFSATVQLWGNPLYHWEALKATGYAWWLDRLKAALEQVDLVRLDHFRGFEAAWHVPADKPTAEVGEWVKGPGADFFAAVRRELGRLPLIAEDLGIITPEVDALREQFGLPGMRVLQFAFGAELVPRYLPHNYVPNTVVYTGTHDNDTTRGWYERLRPAEEALLRRYVPAGPHGAVWDLVRLAWGSVADLALAPLQDVLDLGSDARMNFPGKALGNWQWRYTADQLTPELLARLRDLTEIYERGPQAG
jgi:4-alpha-glucanotransferase